MTVAAVVVRWRGGDEVDRCLRSLLAGVVLTSDRIVLVDSGSGDGGAERLAAHYPDVDVIALAENRSFAHAANAGAATVTEDLIFLLNPDTEVEEGAVTILVEALKQRPRTAGVVPLLVNADGSTQHLWQLRRLPTVGRLAMGRSGAPEFSSPPSAPERVIQPAAAAWLIRRDVWRALGGFDESFAPAWWEDVDFCARMTYRQDAADFPADEGFVVVPELGSPSGRLEPRGVSTERRFSLRFVKTSFAIPPSITRKTSRWSVPASGGPWPGARLVDPDNPGRISPSDAPSKVFLGQRVHRLRYNAPVLFLDFTRKVPLRQTLTSRGSGVGSPDYGAQQPSHRHHRRFRRSRKFVDSFLKFLRRDRSVMGIFTIMTLAPTVVNR